MDQSRSLAEPLMIHAPSAVIVVTRHAEMSVMRENIIKKEYNLLIVFSLL